MFFFHSFVAKMNKKPTSVLSILFEHIKSNSFRERLDGLEKEIRIRSLQRSPGGHSHSHDSAIDSDMYEWETDHVDLDMVINSLLISILKPGSFWCRNFLRRSTYKYFTFSEWTWITRGLRN